MRSLWEIRALTVRLQWRRGFRAALAVAVAMLVCRAFGKPYGWAALGGFEAILVDNGGPYRSRLYTILTLLGGGGIACLLGSFAGGVFAAGANGLAGAGDVAAAALITAAVCFGFTFARVLNQPLASTSVIILVLYFCGLGSTQYTLPAATANAVYFVAGGLGAAVISLFLWPLDPFRPARRNVAAAYALLAEVTRAIPATTDKQQDHDWKRRLRILMEDARVALSQTAARAPARTVRARNLTVLLETADLLFDRTIRLSELAGASQDTDKDALFDLARWLADAELAIASALEKRPAVTERFSGPKLPSRKPETEIDGIQEYSLAWHLAQEEREARQEMDIAFEAVREVWSGVEQRDSRVANAADHAPQDSAAFVPSIGSLVDKLRADWSMQSAMFRHSVRMAIVGAVDVLLLRGLHLSHGFWLAMTSIIVLQPHGSGTTRRGLQRVGGTVAGGIFAAVLAAFVHTPGGILIVITICAGMTLASFAVDYGVYSFFLTPTFVLLSLPYARDWSYAGVRIVTTFLGALVSILAMRVLWPEREHDQLGQLLRAGARAQAEYVRAMLLVWENVSPEHRSLLARARRDCGLASNSAEEALDRLLLEPTLSRKPNAETERALVFTTYLRRLTQSIATMTVLGQKQPAAVRAKVVSRMENLIQRLEFLAEEKLDAAALVGSDVKLSDRDELTEVQVRRMERQVVILERAAVVGVEFSVAALVA